MEKNATVNRAWNIRKQVLCNLNLSAKLPNSGFATNPEIGNIVYIVPTIVGEKPNCLPIVGRNCTIGPVAANR